MPEQHEGFLRELGIYRLPVPIPFEDAGGPVNVYAIENADGTLTLFDTGLGLESSREALHEVARAAGLDLGRVSRLIVSHGHIDHYGNAQWFAERTGAAVQLHPADWGRVVGASRWEAEAEPYSAYFTRLGVSGESVEIMLELAKQTDLFAPRVEERRTVALAEGQRFGFARFEAEVLHCPGHTPGLVCLWASELGLLFSDDHLLARVSPNPLISLGPRGEEDRFLSLPAYLKSIRRVHELDVRWVLPGHGPAFDRHREVIDTLIAFHERRQEKIEKVLAQQEATAVELVIALFRKASPGKLYLTLSEIVGNLDVLEAKGRVEHRLDGGVYRYRLRAG